MNQKINKAGLGIIKKWEGLELEAYRCPAGIYTIGYGHTRGVKPGDKITEKQADIFLRQDVNFFETAVRTLVEVQITDNMFSALVSFCYNVGSSAFNQSTMKRLLNDGEYEHAGQEFLRWNKSDGKVLRGLLARRCEERALFFD